LGKTVTQESGELIKWKSSDEVKESFAGEAKEFGAEKRGTLM
jgi:hypothetical protein